MKKLEIEKTKPTFILSVSKVDIIKAGLFFSISNFFITKTPLANNWRRKKIPSCSYSALSDHWKFGPPQLAQFSSRNYLGIELPCFKPNFNNLADSQGVDDELPRSKDQKKIQIEIKRNIPRDKISDSTVRRSIRDPQTVLLARKKGLYFYFLTFPVGF